jgi:hypothetical protein
MTGQDIIGIANLFIVAIGTGAGISVPFILASNKRSRENFIKLADKVDGKFDEMKKGIEKANAELLPAYRNGGIVTNEKLNSSISYLNNTLSDKIDFLRKSIAHHNENSSIRGNLSEERLVEIIRNEIKK